MKPLNFAGRLTHFFLSNKPLTLIVLLSVILFGSLAYVLTPKQYNPKITLPAFQVITQYPGASAQEVESFITDELEEKILDIPGIDTIASQSLDGGMSIINVQFLIGEDLEQSKTKLTTKIEENLNLRQGTIAVPLIKNMNPEDVPILTLAFTSDNFSHNDVRRQAVDIMNEIKQVEGVSNAEVLGGQKTSLNITLSPYALKERQVSVQDVQRALQFNNLRVNVGGIYNDFFVHEIQVDGGFTSAEMLKKMQVLPGIALEDIANIEEGFEEVSSFVQIQYPYQYPKNTVFVSFAKREGENAITITNRVLKKLENIQTPLHWDVVRNEGETAQKAIGGLSKNLLTSIVIVLFILFIFLGTRAAIVVALAIPITLALVFLSAYFLDQNINRITLFALILSLGLLVDSATVVVENIVRHIQKGDNKKEAICHAVDEIGMGLFLSTLTSIIVFLPLSQVGGMMGAYMGPLSFFVPLALFMSLLVAYILTPFLADFFIPDTLTSSQELGFFDRLSNSYAEKLKTILDSPHLQKKILTGVFATLFIVMMFPVFKLVHFRMLPKADKEQFYVYLDAPEGTDFRGTQKIVEDLNNIIFENPHVTSVQIFTGVAPIIDFNGLYKGAQQRTAPHLATLRVNLTDPQERSISSEDIVLALREPLQQAIQAPATLKLVEDPPGPPVMATLLAKVKGKDATIRNKLAQELQARFLETDEVVDIDTSIEHAAPKTIYKIYNEKALASGVSTSAIAETLQVVLQPQAVSQFHKKGLNEMSFITLEFPKDARDSVQDLSQVFVKNIQGNMVSLDAITEKVLTRNEPIIFRDEQENTAYVSADLGKRSVVYAVIDLLKSIIKNPPLPNVKEIHWNLFRIDYHLQNGDVYSVDWGGEWKMTLENFRDLGLAMIVAFFLIYAVLVAQFRSFGAPGLIMSTVPLGFIGIMTGFVFLDFFGIYLTATALIGFIALMGIVVNNAIIFLEYFYQQTENGVNVKDALVESGKTRLRPIVLTSLTTVLGSLTIASDPVWSGLAWSIVFGLSLSSVLTLGVFPILYWRMQPNVSK